MHFMSFSKKTNKKFELSFFTYDLLRIIFLYICEEVRHETSNFDNLRPLEINKRKLNC